MHWQLLGPAAIASASLFGRPRARAAGVDEVWEALRANVAPPYDLTETLALALDGLGELVPAEGYYAYAAPRGIAEPQLRLTRSETGTPQIGINYAGLVAGAPIRQAPLEVPAPPEGITCEENGPPAEPYLTITLGPRLVLRAALRRRQHVGEIERKAVLAFASRLQPVLALMIALEDAKDAGGVAAVEDATRQWRTGLTLQADKLLGLVSRLGGEALGADAGYCVVWQGDELASVWLTGMGDDLRRALDPKQLPAVPAGLWLAPRLPPGIEELGFQGFALVSVRDGSRGGAVGYGLREAPRAEASATQVLATLSDSLRRSLDSRLLVLGIGRSYLHSLLAVADLLDATANATGDHSRQVSDLAQQIGRQMGLVGADIEAARLGGLLHDIGMVAVDLGLPTTHGPLSEAKRSIIQQHPVVGAALLEGLPPEILPASVPTAVRQHHERWDGHGYPDRLAGPEIDRVARILACAEVFVARTSPRSYRAGLSQGRALHEMLSLADRQIDPEVVSALVAVFAARGVAPQAPEA